MKIIDQPHLTANGIKMATHGDTVALECLVEAHPDPKMMFWKDYADRVPVIQGPKYEISIAKSRQVILKIKTQFYFFPIL